MPPNRRYACATALLASVTLALAGEPEQTKATGETTATTTITKEQMVRFVEEAAAYVKEVGREAALKEFSNPKVVKIDDSLWLGSGIYL
ncbi:MAG: hypothetical protein Q7J98_08005 [Kiritimatiellia bacterium]|nr:hypothetical protein [Kiritimatiellia bacterium]